MSCGKHLEKLMTSGAMRIQSIIAASHQRGDNLHEKLQVQLDEASTFTIKCHENYVSSYTKKLTVIASWWSKVK